MQFETRLSASAPRGTCAEHGVRTVAVSWAGKSSKTTWLLGEFVIALLQTGASLQAVAELAGLDWHTVKQIERRAVERGMARRVAPAADRHPPLPPPQVLGLDEKSFQKGQSYVSIAFELGSRARVLDVGQARGCRGSRSERAVAASGASLGAQVGELGGRRDRRGARGVAVDGPRGRGELVGELSVEMGIDPVPLPRCGGGPGRRAVARLWSRCGDDRARAGRRRGRAGRGGGARVAAGALAIWGAEQR